MSEQTEVVETIYRSVPHHHLIRDLQLDEGGSVRFTWRGTRYRVSDTMNVEVCENGMLVGCDKAILMQALLRRVEAQMALCDSPAIDALSSR